MERTLSFCRMPLPAARPAALVTPTANSFMGLVSTTPISAVKEDCIRESIAFEIRAEFFNVFNHAQFNNPNGSFHTCTNDVNPNCGSQFGVVTSARDPRIGQISAKFYW